MSDVALKDIVRCFLCRRKNLLDSFHKSIDTSCCPVSKKSVKTVLFHLARIGKFELHVSDGEWLCRKCFIQIADYDSMLVNLTRKQKNLASLVEKAATSFDSDIEEECMQEMSSMAEFNDDTFFDADDISDREISETIMDVIGEKPAKRDDSFQPQGSDKKEHKTFASNLSIFSRGLSHSSKPIQCNLCAMRFKNKDRLHKHVVQAHKKFSCSACNFSHRNEDYVLLHMNTHEGKHENQCRFCGKEFTTKISTIRHMEVHLDTKKYQCDKCGLCFSQTTVLYNHKLQHEAEEKPLRCDVCNQVFKTKRTFRHHMVTHRADRPRYSCEFCGKTFTEKYTLKVHKRTHPETGVPAPTSASLPQKQSQDQLYQIDSEQGASQNQDEFMQSHLQSVHMQSTATPSPKFSCIICDQPFTTKDLLNKHMEKEHDVILKSLTIANFSQFEPVSNEEKKACQICGQIFSAHHNLEYHLEQVHGVGFK